MRRLTNEEVCAYIDKSIQILNEYKDTFTKLECKCKKCGFQWSALPSNLRHNKTKCPECAKSLTRTPISAINKKLKHRNIECLSYNGVHSKSTFKCIKCGNEWETFHLNVLGKQQTGCRKCAFKKRKIPSNKIVKFVSKNLPDIKILKLEHKGHYSNIQTECKKCGFQRTVCFSALRNEKTGCPRCAGNTKLSIDKIKTRIQAKNLNIEILNRQYTNRKMRLQCKCLTCLNEWETSLTSLENSKVGCPKCVGTEKLTLEKVKTRVFALNPNIIILSDTYINSSSKLKCKCLKCEKEWMTSSNNLTSLKTGCPRCAKKESKVEIDFLNTFEGWRKDRKILDGKELDAYFAKEKLAIEINGCFWHSTYQTRITKNYHLDKTNICESKGIKLLHFWDFEIKEDFEFCKQIVLENLGLLNDIDDFKIKETEPLCFELYDSDNIKRSNLKLKHIGSNSYEIVEFNGSNKQNLYDYFVLKYKPLKIKATLNRRFFSIFDNYALRLGFKLVKVTKPSYFKYKHEKRYKKYDPKAKNYPKCYDCGELIYESANPFNL